MVSLGHRGRGQAAQVPADVPRVRLVLVNKIDLLAAPRLRPRPASCTTSTPSPRRAADAGERRTGEGVGAGATGWSGPRAREGRDGVTAAPGVTERRLGHDRAPAGGAHRGRRRFFEAEAERIARCAIAWPSASRAAGALSRSARAAAARSDVRHVTVEFVHPVIVGKRALPALGLSARADRSPRRPSSWSSPRTSRSRSSAGRDGRALARVPARAAPDDRVRADAARSGGSPRRARTRSSPRSSWRRSTTCSGSSCTSSSSTAGCSRGAPAATVHDAGASSFLYPFLSEREDDLEAVVADVRASVCMKAAEVGELRAQTLGEGREHAAAARGGAARGVRRRRAPARARQRRLGDRRDGRRRRLPRPARRRGWPPRPALDLTEDSAILTAIANDIGVEAMFSRQVIAHGRSRRRGARALDERRVGERDPRARGGAPARAADDRAASATTAGGSSPSASPTTSS